MDFGPLLAPRFLERFLVHFETGRKDGARLLLAGGRITRKNRPAGFVGDPDRGLFATPAVWDRVRIGMRIAQEEIFGPTVNLIQAKDLDEATKIAARIPDAAIGNGCIEIRPVMVFEIPV